MWWDTLETPILRKWKQEDQEFKAIVGYMGS